jgi:hypothetical protein
MSTCNDNDTAASVNVKETEDRLLLSLSHAPLPTSLLNTLIDQTSTECTAMLDSITKIQSQIRSSDDSNEDEKKDFKSSSSKRNTILHVLATGTPYLMKPGKSQPDHIHQWTKGEVILASLVEKIGMDKFHRVPKDGETKLAGRLIDVKPSDFEFILNHTDVSEVTDASSSSTGEEGKETETAGSGGETIAWKNDCLMEELTWIANNIHRLLIIDQRPNVGIAKVLFPLDPRFNLDDVKQDDLLKFIECVFQKEWSGAKGPLNGADIEIIIVKS